MKKKLIRYGPRALKSGLFYSAGLILGTGLVAFLFSVVTLERIADLNEATRLLIGVILAFIIAGLGGAVGGLAGGFSLPRPDQNRPRWGYAWRSAISMGIPFGLSLYPVLLVFSLLAFFNADAPSRIAAVALMVIGVIFGTLASILMGILSIGRRGFASLVWAGAVGFGLGGAGFGIAFRLYLYSIRNTGLESGQGLWAILGFFLFGLAGGTAWGYVFARLAEEEPSLVRPPITWKRLAVVAIPVILMVIILRPVFAVVEDLLTPQIADLAAIMDSDTEGVHWSDPIALVDSHDASPVIFAAGDQVSVAWTDNQTIFYVNGVWDRIENVTRWNSPIQVSSRADVAAKPQVVLDENDQSHLVWVEDGALLTSVCTDGSCSEPADVSGMNAPACADDGANSLNPALSIGTDGTLLAVWQNENGSLIYSTWPAGDVPPTLADGCVPQTSDNMGNPRLAALADGRFVLVYQNGDGEQDAISIVKYDDGQWGSVDNVGIGHLPSVYVDGEDQIRAAWCGQDGLVTYWNEGNSEIVADLSCLSRPELAMDSSNNMHISWYADQVKNNSEQISMSNILYESIRGQSTWKRPSIVSIVEQPVQPAMAESGGDLHLVWTGGEQLQYASQLQYDCDGFDLSSAGQSIYDIARLPRYRAEDNIVPYCRNQYDRLIITPNPDPAYSDELITLNGGFDRLADLAEAAQYEVLFSNMWYDEDAGDNSPGRVLADAVAVLYANLEANPDQYPRGITVRILLGNPPEVAKGEFTGQIWHVLNDLRNAGLPEMRNEALGWSVEVADFEGAMPHSHIKSMIVDGKTAVAAGFNMSYDHFDADHPSGLGNDRFDLGIQVTGPVAQDARQMFDDLWQGSNRLHCVNFHPNLMPWESTCIANRATSDHSPEVLKYYLTQDDTTAFSMYRTEARDEADRQVIAALASAKETIDAIQVNFTTEMICDLNILYDQVCTDDHLLPYMEAMMDAAQNNGTQVRVLIKGAPIDGVESGVHLDVLKNALEERGIFDQVEVRLFDGPMHPKAILIDDEFLIVGSQNFHYSAFGEGSGLAEYSLGVADGGAANDYKRLFDYQWDRADPVK